MTFPSSITNFYFLLLFYPIMLICHQNVFGLSLFLCLNFISGTKREYDKRYSSETLGSENNAVEDKVDRLKSLLQLHYLKPPHASVKREPPEKNMWSPQILQPTPPHLKACLPFLSSPSFPSSHPMGRKRN